MVQDTHLHCLVVLHLIQQHLRLNHSFSSIGDLQHPSYWPELNLHHFHLQEQLSLLHLHPLLIQFHLVFVPEAFTLLIKYEQQIRVSPSSFKAPLPASRGASQLPLELDQALLQQF